MSGEARTLPASASVCKLCVWRSSCLSELKACQDLTLLPELGRAKRNALADQFPTLADLARANVEGFVHDNKTDFPGIGAATLRKLKIRAELAIAEDPVPFLTRLVVWPTAAVELFFDIETDPMRDLCYLHRFVIREGGDTNAERFEGVFAEDLSAGAECEAFAAAIEWFDQWAKGRDPALRQRLLEYNEDDCRAMRVVVDQMKAFQIFIGVD